VTGRNKILVIFGVVYVVFALVMFLGLRFHSQKNFSPIVLYEMMTGKSIFRDTTTDLCKYQILGDPTEIGNYVKISISCSDGKKASSTLSLSAIENKTVDGFMNEYARIIGFDEKLIFNDNWICYLNGKLLTKEMKSGPIMPKSDVDCYEKSKL
jgi:hypothetical protein